MPWAAQSERDCCCVLSQKKSVGCTAEGTQAVTVACMPLSEVEERLQGRLTAGYLSLAFRGGFFCSPSLTSHYDPACSQILSSHRLRVHSCTCKSLGRACRKHTANLSCRRFIGITVAVTSVPSGTGLGELHQAEATVFLSEFKDAELMRRKVRIVKVDIASAFTATVTLR